MTPTIAAIIAAIQYHSKPSNISFPPPLLSYLSCFYYSNKTSLKQDFLKNNLYTNYFNDIILVYDSDSFSFLAFSTISWAIWEGTSS